MACSVKTKIDGEDSVIESIIRRFLVILSDYKYKSLDFIGFFED